MRDRQISEVEEMETAMDLRRDESSEPKKQVEPPIESQLVETQIRVRELEGELRILRESEIHRKELITESAAKDAELETLRAKVCGLEKRRFESERGTTHWEGCWQDHYLCAMERIETLRAMVEELERTNTWVSDKRAMKMWRERAESAESRLRAVSEY